MLVAVLFLTPAAASAETVYIEADRDATLVEHPDGALANGSGPNLFAGRTSQGQNSTRRALLRFDVAAALPQQAIIESVSLTLFMNRSNPELRLLRLHRVLADWGEGASATSGGGGRPSEPGDATWIHTFHDVEFWIHGGGQFVGGDSASLEVAGSAIYTWESTNQLIHDVRLWNAAPQRNFGWILIGDETAPTTAKSFASREHPDPALRPVLEVTYRSPGKPGDL
jgi:hypothetical protein